MRRSATLVSNVFEECTDISCPGTESLKLTASTLRRSFFCRTIIFFFSNFLWCQQHVQLNLYRIQISFTIFDAPGYNLILTQYNCTFQIYVIIYEFYFMIVVVEKDRFCLQLELA